MTWTSVATLDSDLKATVMLEVDDALVVFGFSGGPFVPLAERQVAIVRVTAAGEAAKTDLGSGWISTASARGEELWAVHATPKTSGAGSDYRLLISEDGGRKWSENGAIPTASLTAVTVEGQGCGWILGVGKLLRTCDRGQTWTTVDAPLHLRGIAQPIASVGEGELVLGGAGLYVTANAGKTWTQLSDREVTATNGQHVVAKDSSAMQIGQIHGSQVVWTARIDEAVQPDAIVANAAHITVRAAPLGKDAGRRVLLFESRDAGGTLERNRVGDSSDTATVALGPTGNVWLLNLSRRLKFSSR